MGSIVRWKVLTESVDSAGINWNEEAMKAAAKYYNQGYNTRSSLLDKLTNILLFTSEEGEYGIVQNGFFQ